MICIGISMHGVKAAEFTQPGDAGRLMKRIDAHDHARCAMYLECKGVIYTGTACPRETAHSSQKGAFDGS